VSSPPAPPDDGSSRSIMRWFRDGVFRRMFRNAGILVGGNVGTAILDLGTLALTARTLGPEYFGILVLVQTYARVVDSLVNFQSWEAVIKFGADTRANSRSHDFKRLIKLGTLLDLGSAMVATVVAIAGILLLGQWQELDTAIKWMALLYCTTILFNLVGTPTAILRLHDRFTWLASLRIFVAALRLGAVAIAWFMGGGLWSFVIIWGAAQILEALLLLSLGWYQLREAGYRGVMMTRLENVLQAFPGILRFVVSTNLISSIKLVKQELDILLIGATLSPALVGIYKVAKQFGMIAAKLMDPLQQAIYPDLAKLWAQGEHDRFARFILRIGVLGGAVGLLILAGAALLGRLVLEVLVGSDYLGAYVPMLLIMAGLAIFAIGVATRPALLTLGRADSILVVEILVSIVFLPLLWVLVQQFSVVGAALAQLLSYVVWLSLMTLVIMRSLRGSPPRPSPGF
jgi:O-antigen/teichoic acid export membrane protein